MDGPGRRACGHQLLTGRILRRKDHSAASTKSNGITTRLPGGMTGTGGDHAQVRSLRRDVHELEDSCWLHGEHFCLSKTVIGIGL
jgi:hypothetical protein